MIDFQPGEKIVLEVRRHWYVLLLETFFLFLLSLVPVVAIGFLLEEGQSLGNLTPLAIFVCTGWLLVMWITFFVIWTNYYLDVWIITDRRIIDIEQHHLFNRDISQFSLAKIQDITVEVSGFIPTMLHLGNIHVETAGQSRVFVIRHIVHPEKVKDVIFGLHERFLKEQGM